MLITLRPMRGKLATPHRYTESAWQPGRRARVLPEPVGARPQTSRPSMASVMVATASGYRRKASMHDTVTYWVTGMSCES